jgi:opacity protein-like surface antigen
MSKTMIAAALAALMLSASAATASAAVKHKDRVAVSGAAQAYARDLGSVSAQSSRNDWDNRSPIYRGPTYIGRY